MTAGQRIDRAGPGDLMTLAVDRGPVPMNIGAVLLLDRGADLDLASLTEVLRTRIGRVPRLRQRLVRTPPGCGRPVWLDHPKFDLAQHLSEVSLPEPGTRASLLEAGATLVCRRLDPGRPLWAARLVTGVEGGRAALVIVMHHVLADGIGGLAVLAALADESAQQSEQQSEQQGEQQVVQQWPQPPPSRSALAREALRSRTAGLASLPGAVRAWGGGLRELGLGARRPVLAPVTSLNRPTGSRRRLSTVRLPRAQVVAAAHRDRCTVNDLILTAVTGALAAVLQLRGERPPELVVSVPVSTRPAATAVDLGNHTGVLPVRVPIIGGRHDRLNRVAELTRDWRARTTSRGQSAGPLSAGFRLLAAIRLFQPFVEHQRLVNTFVTNLRGPKETVDVAGHRVLEVIPVAVNSGNVGVAFDILTYAEQLLVTVVADPGLMPDQDRLTVALTTELAFLVGGSAPPPPEGDGNARRG